MRDLQARLMRLSAFRYLPGMVNPWGERILRVRDSHGDVDDDHDPEHAADILIWREDVDGPVWLSLPTQVDLSDEATLGAVGAVAAEAHGAHVIDVRVDVQPDMSGNIRAHWTARTLRGQRLAGGRVMVDGTLDDVRAACYVAALEAASAPVAETTTEAA